MNKYCNFRKYIAVAKVVVILSTTPSIYPISATKYFNIPSDAENPNDPFNPKYESVGLCCYCKDFIYSMIEMIYDIGLFPPPLESICKKTIIGGWKIIGNKMFGNERKYFETTSHYYVSERSIELFGEEFYEFHFEYVDLDLKECVGSAFFLIQTMLKCINESDKDVFDASYRALNELGNLIDTLNLIFRAHVKRYKIEKEYENFKKNFADGTILEDILEFLENPGENFTSCLYKMPFHERYPITVPGENKQCFFVKILLGVAQMLLRYLVIRLHDLNYIGELPRVPRISFDLLRYEVYNSFRLLPFERASTVCILI